MKCNTHTYKQAGELGLELSLYCPEGGSENSPVIVLLHGGCLMYGGRVEYTPDEERHKHFFEMGATVISVDYRLAPETKLPEIIEDIRDSFRWIHSTGKELYKYDTSRLIVAGHSAGGYLTLMCGFCLETKPLALVSYYGYGDVSGDWYSQPDPFYRSIDLVAKEDSGIDKDGQETTTDYKGRGVGKLYLYYRQNGLWTKEVGGIDPAADPDFYQQYNPVGNITSSYPPVLFLHGEEDMDVPHCKSVEMSDALTQTGVKNRLITIRDEGHGFDKNTDDKQVQEATFQVKSFIRSALFEKEC